MTPVRRFDDEPDYSTHPLVQESAALAEADERERERARDEYELVRGVRREEARWP